MIEMLPPVTAWAAFTLACLVLIVTPDPDMTLFVSKSVVHGRRIGFATFFGSLTGLFGHTMAAALGLSALLAVSSTAFEGLKIVGSLTGLFGHTMAAALGLSALLAVSSTAFEGLKIVGALYLLWLAIDAIRNGSAFTATDDGEPTQSLRAAYLKGLAINALNPKVVLFFVTFLPQFVDAADPHAAAQLIVLGLWLIVLSVPICGAMVWGAAAIAAVLKARPRVMRAIDYLFAGLFGAFAVKLLTARAAN
jgi:threonine/homoserine/homoserine lactone efflux protein